MHINITNGSTEKVGQDTQIELWLFEEGRASSHLQAFKGKAPWRFIENVLAANLPDPLEHQIIPPGSSDAKKRVTLKFRYVYHPKEGGDRIYAIAALLPEADFMTVFALNNAWTFAKRQLHNYIEETYTKALDAECWAKLLP